MDRRASLETKRAMFWAQLAAQCAGEKVVTANRVIAALLRTASVRTYFAGAQIDSARLLVSVDDPDALPFDECERRVLEDLARIGVQFGSIEHRTAVGQHLLPQDSVVRDAVQRVFAKYDEFAVSPLELLLMLKEADPALAQRLAPL